MPERYEIQEIAGKRWIVWDTREHRQVGVWQRTKTEARKRVAELKSRDRMAARVSRTFLRQPSTKGLSDLLP